MRKELIFRMENAYRDALNIYGYHFGIGEKSTCIVGALRGNEVQQMYICCQLVRALRDLEKHGNLVANHEILVIPSVNHSAMNIGKRFWPVDNTDINRMFPGYDQGETTQRIAAGLFQVVQQYNYGIQFASFYMRGNFVPHVRMMETGYENASLANLFGLPYVVLRKPRPVDTLTLNYNWQIWNTNAFSVYTNATDQIDETSARQAVAAVLRFLMRMGVIRYHSHAGFIATTIHEEELMNVRSNEAGIFRRKVEPGEEIHMGEIMAEIIDPCEGEVLSSIAAPTDGIVFFAHSQPLVMENAVLFRIIRRLHE